MSSTESGSKVDQTKQTAADVKDEVTSKAADVAGSAKEQARSVVVDARDQAAEVLGTSRDALHAQATEQAKSLSTTLGGLSDQLSTMADTSDAPQTQVAELARSAADTLSRGARRLDEGGVDGVLDDLKRMARNRPGAFLIGSIAAGFALGRLVKHVDVRKVVEQAKSEIADSDESGADAPTDSSPTALPASTAPALPPPSAGARNLPAETEPDAVERGVGVPSEVAERP